MTAVIAEIQRIQSSGERSRIPARQIGVAPAQMTAGVALIAVARQFRKVAEPPEPSDCTT
jgi:hypothetical protein